MREGIYQPGQRLLTAYWKGMECWVGTENLVFCRATMRLLFFDSSNQNSTQNAGLTLQIDNGIELRVFNSKLNSISFTLMFLIC